LLVGLGKCRFVVYFLSERNFFPDFSDSIATRTKRGYKASEIYEGDPVDEDHFEEKYNRICAEVKQLLADSQKVLSIYLFSLLLLFKREKQPLQINKSDISFLHDMLKSMGELSTRAAGQPEVRVLRLKLYCKPYIRYL
jgi:hypothetical protein